MRRVILALYLISLFLIGSMIGVTFVKQKPESGDTVLLADSPANHENTAVHKQIEIFSVRLNRAVKQTTGTVYHKLIDLLDYLKLQPYFSNIESFFENKSKFITMEDLKEPKLPAKALNKKTRIVSAIQNPLKSDISSKSDQLENITVSNPIAGRPDPFLPLAVKISTILKPKTEKRPIIENKPKIEEPPKIEEKPKIEKIDLKSRILNNCHLRGIVIGDSPIAYIEDQNGYRKVTIGDFIAEGQVINITETGLVIRLEGEQFVLNLEE